MKSLRKGQANISESYASVEDGGLWLINSYIPEYQGAGRFFQHEPRRKRRLLLHAKEIHKLVIAVERQGMTMVPLELYFNARGIAKLKIALAQGKKLHDKREADKKRDWNREKARRHAGEGLMSAIASPDFLTIDWSRLPRPSMMAPPGTCRALRLPDMPLPRTDGSAVSLAALGGRTVVFAYPDDRKAGHRASRRLGRDPGRPRLHPAKLRLPGSSRGAAGRRRRSRLRPVDPGYPSISARPRSGCTCRFPYLSDAALRLTTAMQLPAMLVGGATLLKRMALIIDGGVITHVFYPVFPPDRNAAEVLEWLRTHRA